MFDEALDLSAITRQEEHWRAAATCIHPGQARPRLEPGLLQWLPLWRHWRSCLHEIIREAVATEIEQRVIEAKEEVQQWFETLDLRVQKAYGLAQGKCTVQLPVLKAIAEEFGWQDLRLFDEMTQGFQLLGPSHPGVGWRLRSDARYSAPKNLDDFFVENHDLVQNKLRSAKVDPCWEVLAEEIAADVQLGRMEGPFAAPDSWCKQTVPLPSHARAARLKPPPIGQLACSFAFAVHQVGSDGRDKVRRAEDWRQSGANSTVSVPDTPAYHGIEAFVHVARALSAECECAPGDLRVWGLDHEAAYRQLPVANPDHAFVILNTPSGPTLWRHNVLMFGSAASVWGYCRVADLMSWLDRCLLLIPMLHFVDDFGGVDSSNLAQSAFECSQRVCGALGLKFKLSKAQPPKRAHKLQGVYLQLGETEATVAMTPERAQRFDN